MPTHRGPKRAAAAQPSRALGMRVMWMLGISAIALAAIAGWLAAGAASALGSSVQTTASTYAVTTVTAATTTAATTTAGAATTTDAATSTTGTATDPTTTTGTTTSTDPTTSTTTSTAPASTGTTATATTTASTTTTGAEPIVRLVGTSRQKPSVQTVATTAATTTNATTTTATTATTTTTTTAATTTQSPASVTSTTTVDDPWASTLGTDSATLLAQSELNESVLGGKPPAKLVKLYKAAAKRYDVPWEVLAAINAVETDYGTDEKTSSAGAVGWMQFEPATFAKYEVRLDDRTPSPYNAKDAIYAAANMLSADGAHKNLRTAIYDYNHVTWYVDEITFVAAEIVGDETAKSATDKDRIASMLTTAKLLAGTPYLWGGGHSGWTDSGGYDCSGFVSAVLHASGYLSEPQTTQTLPSADGIENGPGKYVTMFDRTDAGTGDDHVIIDIDGQWWESGGSDTDGGSADVHRITAVSEAYLATFNRELHPRGL